MRRILSCNRSFYLDDSNGAAVANRALLGMLARRGFGVEALCGTACEAGDRREPTEVLDEQGRRFEAVRGGAWTVGPGGVRVEDVPRLVLEVDGVRLTIQDRRLRHPRRGDADEAEEFLRLAGEAIERFRPDVLLTYGGDRATRALLARARERGIATVFTLHNLAYRDRATFGDVDVVTVPSAFAAEHYRRSLGLDPVVLPNVVDFDHVRAERSEPTYLTFINPSVEKGVFPFVRIADELGRRRPEIPILVVESRGTEAGLVDCGLDLRVHGNVSLMARTPDPRDFWGVTRVLLMPSLVAESQGLAAVEALVNALPIVASDRGALPETLGEAGILLPLPRRLAPSRRLLPTAREVAPWVEAVLRLWDDRAFFEEHRRRARVEARRWAPEALESSHLAFFSRLPSACARPRPGLSVAGSARDSGVG